MNSSVCSSVSVDDSYNTDPDSTDSLATCTSSFAHSTGSESDTSLDDSSG